MGVDFGMTCTSICITATCVSFVIYIKICERLHSIEEMYRETCRRQRIVAEELDKLNHAKRLDDAYLGIRK